ncbi:MAG: hypothetical protein EA361_15580 [Bacteroidetes bacterium]|nr:MAG: hypothetical protein EA361_15580 [Bacteroidota bacterium]
MRIMIKSGVLLIIFSMLVVSLQAQSRLIRRLQQETEKKIINEIIGEDEKKDEKGRSQHDSNDRMSGQNRRGAGLEADAPDVRRSIADAGSAYETKDYIAAKRSVRNALWGVEIEIGQNVLKSLPTSVAGLEYIESRDEVSSMGAGFVGLIIGRQYQGKDDMQLQATIGNDSAILGLAGLYWHEGMYMQSTEQPNQKEIRFQENRAVINYSDEDGYTLSVPFGQSSVFLINGINFENENQFMSAANQFSINNIKNILEDK